MGKLIRKRIIEEIYEEPTGKVLDTLDDWPEDEDDSDDQVDDIDEDKDEAEPKPKRRSRK